MNNFDVAGEFQTIAIKFANPKMTNKQVIEKLLEINQEIPLWIKELKKEQD